MAWDSGTSIFWFLNLDRTNVNLPPFQNFLFGSFYLLGEKLGNPVMGIGLYCYIQMIIEAVLLAKIIAFQYTTFTNKWYLFPNLLYLVIPAFPIYAMTMGKDSNLAIAVLLFVYYSMQYAEDPKSFMSEIRKLIGLGVAIVLIALLRNGAGYVPAIAYVILTIKKGSRIGVIVSSFTLVIVIAIYQIIPALLGIPHVEIKESMSLPLQTVAYYVQQHEDEITEDQKATINEIIDFEKLRDNYDPDLADPIKDISHFTPSSAKKLIAVCYE